MSLTTDTTQEFPESFRKARPRCGDAFGGYILEERLGMSSTAIVFRTHTNVVLKIAGASDVAFAAFLNEINATRRLAKHPYILKYSDFLRWNGYLYVVTPYYELGSLARLVHTERLSLPEVIFIFEQIAVALDYAHQKGVVHADVKSSNVLMTNTRRQLVVSDFNVSHVDGVSTLSGPHGTPGYAPREQLKQLPVSPKWDSYALGAMLVEVATRRPPDPHRRLDPRRLPQVGLLKHGPLRDLAARLLSEVPYKRPSMLEVWDSLEKIASSIQRMED